MIPRRIAGATHKLGPPRGWDEAARGKCSDLWIRIEPGSIFASAWEPTPDELRLLNEGGSIVLRVVCDGQPPVSLSAEVAG